MHIFSHQDCIPFHTPLSGGHLSHYMIFVTLHNTGSAIAVPTSSYSRVISFKHHASNMPSHHSNWTGGAYWMTSLKQVGETRTHMGGQHTQGPHKIIQLATLLPNGNGGQSTLSQCDLSGRLIPLMGLVGQHTGSAQARCSRRSSLPGKTPHHYH